MFKTNKMDLNIKKDLTSNWFKLLQDAFCNDISILENNIKINNPWREVIFTLSTNNLFNFFCVIKKRCK